MNVHQIRIAFTSLFLLSFYSLSVFADELYVITIDAPSNGATLALNTGYVISGNVDWPFYREDIDHVAISVTKMGNQNPSSSESQAITSFGYSSCTFSSSPITGSFTSPGTYTIKSMHLYWGIPST